MATSRFRIHHHNYEIGPAETVGTSGEVIRRMSSRVAPRRGAAKGDDMPESEEARTTIAEPGPPFGIVSGNAGEGESYRANSLPKAYGSDRASATITGEFFDALRRCRRALERDLSDPWPIIWPNCGLGRVEPLGGRLYQPAGD